MAYKVSQIRKIDTNETYMQNITNSLEETYVRSKNPFGQENKTFTDFALQFNDNNTYFSNTDTYYLRFAIHQIPEYYYSGDNTLGYIQPSYEDADYLQLTILLSNKIPVDADGHQEQVIGYCNVPKAQRSYIDEDNSDNYSQYTMIFTPTISNEYNQIIFRINRNTYDAIEKQTSNNQNERGRDWLIAQYINRNDLSALNETDLIRKVSLESTNDLLINTKGRRIIWDQSERIIENEENSSEWVKTGITGELSILQDLVPTSKNSSRWLKLGYQSRPGNLIVVNREPIRVGRSGIFELNNGTEITNFMVTAPLGYETDKIDPFLLDYAYNG